MNIARTDLSILCMPGRHFTTKLNPQPSLFILHFYYYYVYVPMIMGLGKGETACVLWHNCEDQRTTTEPFL